jgi:thioesterase domain-containing protein
VVRGYLRRSELTAERFLPDPYGTEAGARLYRTGDMARYLTDGNIEYLGRIDHQVKIRGFRIELGEIEVMLSSHPAVRQCVVIALQDEGGDKRLVAYVVGEQDISGADLAKYLKGRMPEYMIPEAIIILETMPVTANGKIDRRRLATLSDARRRAEGRFVAPRDILEFQLVQIWERVLGIHPIGVTDNFFDLGGHSLLAAGLMARIRNTVGRNLPLTTLFQGGTVEHLASILRREASSISGASLIELQSSGSNPPLIFVHPTGGNVLCYLDLARCLGSDRPFYGLQTAGLYGERPLYTKIEHMAAHYIEELRNVQPDGPYFIGGWSLGGLIAYEMAQQLVAQGQKIGQLLLLDTGAWTSLSEQIEEAGQTEADDAELGQTEADDAELLMLLLFDEPPVSREYLGQFEGDERINYILSRAKSVDLLPPDVDVAQARSFLRAHRTNVNAMRRYVPRVYAGSVTLFKTAKQFSTDTLDGSAQSSRVMKMIQDPTMGWGELAAGGVQIIDIPGEHETMVRKPHVETLALMIRTSLDVAQTVGGEI